MGIDTHSLQMLHHARVRFGDIGDTITLGRMTVLLGPRAALKWTGSTHGAYGEALLKDRFGASLVDSIDNSPYEGANIVADMNHPLPSALAGRYDTVIDFGCTEHIFDVAQALRNITSLCKIGGRILHVVPSNGYCGHGFYQFSPELFFSWYSPANGFADTEVFLADLCDIDHWYRVTPPRDGKRINIRSCGEVYALALTQRAAERTKRVQQSDYEYAWTRSSDTAAPHAPGKLAKMREALSRFHWTARIAYILDSALAENGAKPLRQHKSLTRVSLPRL